VRPSRRIASAPPKSPDRPSRCSRVTDDVKVDQPLTDRALFTCRVMLPGVVSAAAALGAQGGTVNWAAIMATAASKTKYSTTVIDPTTITTSAVWTLGNYCPQSSSVRCADRPSHETFTESHPRVIRRYSTVMDCEVTVMDPLPGGRHGRRLVAMPRRSVFATIGVSCACCRVTGPVCPQIDLFVMARHGPLWLERDSHHWIDFAT